MAKKFNFVHKFSLSGKRLLMWNDRKILVGSIDEPTKFASQVLQMQKIDLEISRDFGFSGTKTFRKS